MTRAIILLATLAAGFLAGQLAGSPQRDLACVRDVVTWQLICR